MDDFDKLDALLDKLTLESTADQWRARTVLTQVQWSIFNELKTRLEIDDEHLILAGCALSAFFDPTIHVAGHTADVRKMSALFAIVRGRNRVKTRPLLFIADEECDASGGTEFLEIWGAPLLRFDSRNGVSDFVEKVIAQLHTGPHYSGDRQPINAIEGNVAFHVRATNEYVCLHEVAVLRLIPEKGGSPEDLNALRSLGPVDLLIHSEEPNAPLLCVEIDGQTHLEEGRKRKDHRKTTLLCKIGIPVLRVLPGDIRLWQNTWGEEFLLYARIFLPWVRRLASEVRTSVTEETEDHQHEQRRLSVRNQLARTIFDSDYYDLIKEKRAKIDANILLVDLDEEKYWSDILRSCPTIFDPSQSTDDPLEPPSRLAKYVGQVRVRGTVSSGICAEAVFRAGGVSEVLQSSTYFLSHPSRDDSEIYEQVSNLALKHVYWQADKRLASRSR